jgi:hypothetical protein
MEKLLLGMLGGVVPAALVLIVYFISLAGRFAKIENDICWLKKVLSDCLPHLKIPSQ